MSTRGSILIIVENLPVPFDRRVWQESCALRDAGYEVVVICPRMRGYHAPEEVLDGIHIYRHWISGEAGGFLGFLAEYATALWGEWWLAWKVWRRHRFKVVHLCNPPDLLFLVAWPFKWLGVKVIYDVHDLWPEMFETKFNGRGAMYRLVRLAERLTYACADIVLATNESVKRTAIARGKKSPDEVYVVRTSPKIGKLDAPADGALKKGRRYLVGFVGVMGDTDGVRYLIDAAEEIVHGMGRTDVQFLLMGIGPEYERLLALRAGKGLNDFVDMPGRVSDDMLATALQTIDVGVACDPINVYNDHCTMNKTLEYMAFGKPQVMFAVKEGKASAGAAARYVDENSSHKLAEAIVALLDDPEERDRMGGYGRTRLKEELNWERSVEQLTAAYAAAHKR